MHSNEKSSDKPSSYYMRKTGLDEETSQNEADTTYMTGTEAVEKKFADVLTMREPQIAAAPI
jgi:ATP-dependent protease ClpP protease subunit